MMCVKKHKLIHLETNNKNVISGKKSGKDKILTFIELIIFDLVR